MIADTLGLVRPDLRQIDVCLLVEIADLLLLWRKRLGGCKPWYSVF